MGATHVRGILPDGVTDLVRHLANEVESCAEQAGDLRFDPRDPSMLHLSKIDLERRLGRLALQLRGWRDDRLPRRR